MLSEREKEIIKELNHPLYTVGFLEAWVGRNDNVMVNAPAALQAMGANGFYTAVHQMALIRPFEIGDRFRDEFGTYTLTEIEEDTECVCYYTQQDDAPGIREGRDLEELKEMEYLGSVN